MTCKQECNSFSSSILKNRGRRPWRRPRLNTTLDDDVNCNRENWTCVKLLLHGRPTWPNHFRVGAFSLSLRKCLFICFSAFQAYNRSRAGWRFTVAAASSASLPADSMLGPTAAWSKPLLLRAATRPRCPLASFHSPDRWPRPNQTFFPGIIPPKLKFPSGNWNVSCGKPLAPAERVRSHGTILFNANFCKVPSGQVEVGGPFGQGLVPSMQGRDGFTHRPWSRAPRNDLFYDDSVLTKNLENCAEA